MGELEQRRRCLVHDLGALELELLGRDNWHGPAEAPRRWPGVWHRLLAGSVLQAATAVAVCFALIGAVQWSWGARLRSWPPEPVPRATARPYPKDKPAGELSLSDYESGEAPLEVGQPAPGAMSGSAPRLPPLSAWDDPAPPSTIQQAADNIWDVDPELWPAIFRGQSGFIRGTHFIPHEVEGRVVGVKIYGIGEGSILAALGLQSGDMLTALNGFDMTDPDRALEAYNLARHVPVHVLELERRGERRLHIYRTRKLLPKGA